MRLAHACAVLGDLRNRHRVRADRWHGLGVEVIYARELWHDAIMALHAARNSWLRARWLRRHGNPDLAPF